MKGTKKARKGRPLKAAEERLVGIPLRVHPAIAKALAAYVASRFTTRTDATRRALVEFLERQGCLNAG